MTSGRIHRTSAAVAVERRSRRLLQRAAGSSASSPPHPVRRFVRLRRPPRLDADRAGRAPGECNRSLRLASKISSAPRPCPRLVQGWEISSKVAALRSAACSLSWWRSMQRSTTCEPFEDGLGQVVPGAFKDRIFATSSSPKRSRSGRDHDAVLLDEAKKRAVHALGGRQPRRSRSGAGRRAAQTRAGPFSALLVLTGWHGLRRC